MSVGMDFCTKFMASQDIRISLGRRLVEEAFDCLQENLYIFRGNLQSEMLPKCLDVGFLSQVEFDILSNDSRIILKYLPNEAIELSIFDDRI